VNARREIEADGADDRTPASEVYGSAAPDARARCALVRQQDRFDLGNEGNG
jgi:hypothetical protein